jgi:hypothetical protein
MANVWSSSEGVAHLERLTALREKGSLSDEEFQQAKQAYVAEAATGRRGYPSQKRRPILAAAIVGVAILLILCAFLLLVPTKSADQRLQAAISRSDDYQAYGPAMLAKARGLVAGGRCDVADFERANGWKKVQAGGEKRYLVHCGGSSDDNRIYLEVGDSKEIERSEFAAAEALPAVKAEPVDPYAGAKLDSCRMNTCMWSKDLGIRTVRQLGSGVLRAQTTLEGTSDHKDGSYADRYSPDLPIRWERERVTTYAFCSKTQPATAFKDRFEGASGKWIGHLLDLFDTYGYNYMSAVSYLRICHGVEFGEKDIEKKLRALGYRPGTITEQITFGSPDELGERALKARRDHTDDRSASDEEAIE